MSSRDALGRNATAFEPLVDGQGRLVEQLRVSVTDRCDMACAYCRPAGADAHHPACDLAPLRDLQRLVALFAAHGVAKVRVTGGEPLLRKGIFRFLAELRQTPGIKCLALTTNGMRLATHARKLREIGVDGINISLDSLNEKRFAHITGRPALSDVVKGIEAALALGFAKVKLNMVVMRGVNDHEVADFARLTYTAPLEIRFIEFMPATPALWSEKKYMPMSAIMERLLPLGPLTPMEKEKGSGPALIYRLSGAVGSLGFIPTVSRHFCSDCDRLRITSRGRLMTCLFGNEGVDFRKLFVMGATDKAIINAVKTALQAKNALRTLPVDNRNTKQRPAMIAIGG